MDNEVAAAAGGLSFLAILLLGAVALIMWGCPKYDVYQQTMTGRAELARADQNRQIQVAEAQGKLDAAKLLNQADIERAKGVAGANKIIGDSLKDNEAYLRYLWIDGMKETHDQIVYIPTEAGLPILEAGRAAQHPAPAQAQQ